VRERGELASQSGRTQKPKAPQGPGIDLDLAPPPGSPQAIPLSPLKFFIDLNANGLE